MKYFILLIFLSLFSVTFYIGLNKDPSFIPSNLIEKEVPKFTLKKSNLFKSFEREDLLKDNKKIVNFFASWCPPCKIEHPNLLITMSNVKFSELGSIESSNKIKDKRVKKFNLVLKSDNSYDFNSQISGAKLGNFIKKNWGIEIDNKGRTSYSSPCIIRIYREDNERHLKQFLNNDYKNNKYDLIVASQAYRAASSVKVKVNNVIGPLMRLLNKSAGTNRLG